MNRVTAMLTDATGQPVALPRAPRRIVSLIPSITETLFALGLDAAIVGVTVYCVEPREGVARKAKVGGEKNPNLDRIRDLSPDLVIANVEENLKEHVDTLRQWGIPVWVTYPKTVRAGIDMVRELGALTSTAERAETLASELTTLLQETRQRVSARPGTSVFYPIWRNPYMTINCDTYIHDMLTVCGGANLFGDRAERYPTISLDEVAAARPSVIVLPDEPFRFRPIHVRDFAPYPDIPAVRSNRIHLMDGKLFCWYGPRIADALRRLPDLFAEPP